MDVNCAMLGACSKQLSVRCECYLYNPRLPLCQQGLIHLSLQSSDAGRKEVSH